MFPDAFVLNLIVFVIGQIAACGYLRTGLVRTGVWLLIATWVFADVALVARFAYDQSGSIYVAALLAMQATSIVAFVIFAFTRVRRRLPGVRARHEELRREAFVLYLKGDLAGAQRAYRRMLRTDPWDVTTRLGLGTALLRDGAIARGKRMLRSAAGLDSDAQLRDAVDEELGRVR